MVGFLSDKYRIFSGGDDYSSALWDIASATEITSYSEHTDYVRCGCASKVNADVFITGLVLFFIYTPFWIELNFGLNFHYSRVMFIVF